MEGYYTIAQIAKKTQRTPQAIYQLIKKNKELEALLNGNTETIGKGKQYSETILEWIVDYYGKIDDDEKDKEQEKQADSILIMSLQMEIKQLKDKLASVEKQLEKAQAEKEELSKQNGLVLLLLSQEKQEKQKLLEAPKERKGLLGMIFRNKRKESVSNDENGNIEVS